MSLSEEVRTRSSSVASTSDLEETPPKWERILYRCAARPSFSDDDDPPRPPASSSSRSVRPPSDDPRQPASIDDRRPPPPPPVPSPPPYRRQPYPDNHTDDSFLERVVVNGRVIPRSLSAATSVARVVSAQLACAVLASVAVAHVHAGRVAPARVLAANVASTACALLGAMATRGPRMGLRVAGARIAAAAPALAAALAASSAPFRAAAVAAVSTDVAVAGAIAALFVHVLSFDYARRERGGGGGGGGGGGDDFDAATPPRNGVSLSAAALASTLLCSRLDSTAAARACALTSVTMFATVQGMRSDARRASTRAFRAEVRPIHWSPYDRVGVVNADP